MSHDTTPHAGIPTTPGATEIPPAAPPPGAPVGTAPGAPGYGAPGHGPTGQGPTGHGSAAQSPTGQGPTGHGSAAQSPTGQGPDPRWRPGGQPTGPAPTEQGWWLPSRQQQTASWGNPAATTFAATPPTAPPGGPGVTSDGRPAWRRRATLIAASTLVVALLAGFGGGWWASSLNSPSPAAASSSLSQQSSPTVSANLTPAAKGSVQQVAAAILPSVVSVLSSSASSAGEGSGVILSADGLILTNNHVIDGASTLEVQFNDGSTATATVVGADATDDLAVIKAKGVSGLTPATLGTSADLQVGQDVVAVGSPLGLSATVTSGIVSALNRPVATSNAQQQPQQQLPGRGQTQTPTVSQSTVISAIQTDAAINPGNSGGPLVDTSGKVIGINSAIASLSSSASGEAGSIGVGFAIPIDQAKRIADEIIQTGKASHAVLGASVGDATVNGNSLLTSGAKVSAITSGGGAEAAGLQVGDVITKVGEQKVESADALVAAIRSATPNSAVSITYTRGTAGNTVNVTLGSSTE